MEIRDGIQSHCNISAWNDWGLACKGMLDYMDTDYECFIFETSRIYWNRTLIVLTIWLLMFKIPLMILLTWFLLTHLSLYQHPTDNAEDNFSTHFIEFKVMNTDINDMLLTFYWLIYDMPSWVNWRWWGINSLPCGSKWLQMSTLRSQYFLQRKHLNFDWISIEYH